MLFSIRHYPQYFLLLFVDHLLAIRFHERNNYYTVQLNIVNVVRICWLFLVTMMCIYFDVYHNVDEVHRNHE